MITPIDFSRLEVALASVRGWLELVVALLCVGLAWAIDRRLEKVRAERRQRGLRVPGTFVRIAFPLLALAITFVAQSAWRHYVGPPFFLAIAMPILVALAVVRLLIYGLRRLFPSQKWLPASEIAIGTTIWGLAILYFLGVLPEITSALDALVLPLGKTRISVLTILESLAVVVVALMLTLWISGLIEHRLEVASHLDANLRAALARIIRAILIVIGLLVALEQIGFDLTLLTFFGGALGVGIGLGLQKLASNYIAGFTILLDRSIRLGDVITVDNKTGVVSRVTSRYVVMRGGDGIEAIVPNETLVTTTVLNQSYTSTEIRIAVQVQVSYDSDVERALALLLELAQQEPRVLRGERVPSALVLNLADSGITLELGVWVADPGTQGGVKSALYRGILKEFAANGIEIPFPRRDVRIAGTISSESATATPKSPKEGAATGTRPPPGGL